MNNSMREIVDNEGVVTYQKKKIRTWASFDPEHDAIGEINTKKSKTVPDLSLSIREILELSKKGLTSGLRGFDPLYQYEENEELMEDMPINFHKMDLVDKHEILTNIKAKIKEYRRLEGEAMQKATDERKYKILRKQWEDESSKNNINPSQEIAPKAES